MAVGDWSTTAADNTSLGAIGLSDSTQIVAMDDAIREMMAQIATWVQSSVYPVGSLYQSTLATNPATLLGFGTWAEYGSGRALVAVGNNGQRTWTAGLTFGSDTHTLNGSEMPSHVHGVGSVTVSNEGNHHHLMQHEASNTPFGYEGNQGGFLQAQSVQVAGANLPYSKTSTAGSHAHTLSGFTDSAGSGAAHNNVQPSIAIYVWRRTA